MKRNQYIYFKPTGETFSCKKDFDQAHEDFFEGELTEDYINYCADQSLHAFWVNYKDREHKVQKKEFCEKFKMLINQMLRDL